jgi:hypothetical protein
LIFFLIKVLGIGSCPLDPPHPPKSQDEISLREEGFNVPCFKLT